MGAYFRELSSITNFKVKEQCNLITDRVIEVIGSIIKNMEMDSISGLMEIVIEVNTRMESEMDME